MFDIRFFRFGFTSHVILVKNGNLTDKGPAFSGFVGPHTTVAIVPTSPQIVDFTVSTRSKDMQKIEVSGNVTVSLSPLVAVSTFDLTVSSGTNSYVTPWQSDLKALVTEQVLGPIRDSAKGQLVHVAILAHQEFEKAVIDSITADDTPLGKLGIEVTSCSIVKIEPRDGEVAQSIGVTEREQLLTEADSARHKRQMAEAVNERAVSQYEAETALELEKARADLVDTAGANTLKEAEFDATAAGTRLDPYKAVPAPVTLAAAIMKLAEGGRVSNLVISPEIFTALKSG